MKKRNIIFSLLAAFAILMPTASASAATIARWDFDENQATHPDSSGNNLTATSGSDVKSISMPTTTNPNNRVIRAPWVSNIMTAVLPERLTRVPHNQLLNPKNGNFAITISFKNNQSYGNMIQKGQSAAVGGYYKWEMPSGRVTCLFRDNQKRDLVVKSPLGTDLRKAWHTVKCALTRGTNGTARAQMTLNGNVVHTTAYKVYGSIANTVGLTMMGKANCNQTSTTCDYYAGDFDYVLIEN